MAQQSGGSTQQLGRLCLGYFGSYVLTGVLVKYFTAVRTPKLSEVAYLFNNTLASCLVCVAAVVALGWIGRLAATSNRSKTWGPFRLPAEVAYIVPSGVCTAVVIPATTLMYLLPISVMVAMVIMRGSVIVISRVVDEIQIRQGILRKRVDAAENWAVVFALLAVATNVLLLPVAHALETKGVPIPKWLGVSAARGSFDFLNNGVAMAILGSYIAAYSARIYIMNYYKNTRGRTATPDNRGFFAVEQIAATVTMLLVGAFVIAAPRLLGSTHPAVLEFRSAALHPEPAALIAGIPYAFVAFFSVFIFMFQGRTATFAGLVNRLTSLVAGTTATVLLWALFGLKFPTAQDWLSVGFILVAVYFLTRSERRRASEPASGVAPAVVAEPPAIRSSAGGVAATAPPARR